MTLYFLWGTGLFLEDAVFEDPGMVRESGISATKPVFPDYLFPSFWFSLPRLSLFARDNDYDDDDDEEEGEKDKTGSEDKQCSKDTTSTEDKKGQARLSRIAADTLRCSSCSADLALSSQIISKGFTGRFGRAYLVAPMERASASSSGSLLNIRVGRSENRQLVTGWHTVADIACGVCARKLGWKYVDAREASQQYKIGKFILETERVVTYRTWEDVVGVGREALEGDEWEDEDEDDEGGQVEFDSEDEDECEDVFAGVWNARTAAARRGRRVMRK